MSAGCSASISKNNPSKEIRNPTGHAQIRPLDEPLLRHGITPDSEQYLFAQLFQAGDGLAVVDGADASEYSEAIDELTESQFAVLTYLRCAAAAPAYFWPRDSAWREGRISIDLKRVAKDPVSGIDEAVGVALTVFEVDVEPPPGADIVFPSGALISTDKSA